MTIWWCKTLTCPIYLLYCNVQEYKDSIKDVFIYLFILLLFFFNESKFVFKIGRLKRWISQMCHHVLDFRLYFLVNAIPGQEMKVYYHKALKWLKWNMQVIKLLYIAMFEGRNNLCGERSGSAKEIARDTLHIRIAVACISIFDLLMIRYSI